QRDLLYERACRLAGDLLVVRKERWVRFVPDVDLDLYTSRRVSNLERAIFLTHRGVRVIESPDVGGHPFVDVAVQGDDLPIGPQSHHAFFLRSESLAPSGIKERASDQANVVQHWGAISYFELLAGPHYLSGLRIAVAGKEHQHVRFEGAVGLVND